MKKDEWNAVDIELTVNGERLLLSVPPGLTLLELLRNELGITSVKQGCDDSNCGACTVLMDRRPVKSCCMLAAQADGSEIETVDSLEMNGVLHPIQQAFIDHFAFQCGFCTPAMILMAKALLDENPRASEEEIRDWLHGNICRCTGYRKIVEAIASVQASHYITSKVSCES